MDLQDGKRMFGDLKSKLGFGSRRAGEEYDDVYYEEGYDTYAEEYNDYGEYGYDEGYEDSVRSSRDPYSSRISSRTSTRSVSSSRSSGSTLPRLVSIDDVRANTQIPNSLNRDPLPSRHPSTSSVAGGINFDNGRTMVDASLPPQLTPAGAAAQAAAASRRRSSEGLDSLFSPTTANGEASSGMSAAAGGSVGTARTTFDPYDTYSGSSMAGYSAARSLAVVQPSSYADVERVSKSLKAGDAVVLVLSQTPDALSKRVLDFSFGVASALDANVDCIADKVFAITRVKDLTDAERMTLRSQGVL